MLTAKFDWIYGIWFTQSPDQKRNYIHAVGLKGDQPRIRCRLYSDNKPSWADLHPNDGTTVEQYVSKSIEFVENMAKRFNGTVDFIELKCDVNDPKITDELLKKNWVRLENGKLIIISVETIDLGDGQIGKTNARN